MAILKSIQTGNFTDSSTWGVIDSGTYSSSTTNLNLLTSILSSGNFTVSSNIEISGVMLRLASRTLTPSGTLTFSFRNVTTSTDLKTVTINVSDIPNLSPNGFGAAFSSCWVFFKFDAPITLSTTQTYQLRANTSVGNQVSIYTAASSVWDRALVTTTNATPSATDSLFVVGENTSSGVNSWYTVTMNNTASGTTFGQVWVSLFGTLRWADTPGSTFHLKLNNNLLMDGNGEVIMGDETTPIPSTTNCLLEITCSSPIQYRINVGAASKLITRGADTTVKTEINGNISAGATSFITSTTTDWNTGDTIVIAGTSRSGIQNDVLTIASRSGNTINTTSTFSFAHLGSGDVVADVGKLNRNVKIFSTSATNPTNIIGTGNYAEININYTELFDLGHTSQTTQSALNATSVAVILKNSSIYNATSRSVTGLFYDNSTTSVFVDNNLFFRSSSNAISANRPSTALLAAVPLTITNNLSIQTNGMTFSVAGNFNGNTVCGAVSGNVIGINVDQWLFSGTMDNCKVYSVTRGVQFGNINVVNLPINGGGVTINNLRSFRNSVCGIQFSNSFTSNLPLTFINARLFGNARSIDTNGSITGNFIFRDSFFWGGSGEVSTNLLIRQGSNSSTHTGFYFDNCRFGVDYAGNVSNFSSAILLLNGLNNSYFNNCLFSGTEASTPGVPIDYFPGYVSINHNQIAGTIKTFKAAAILTKDTTITLNGLPTIRMAPQSSSFNAIGDPVKVAVKSGQTLTISVRVRKSASPDTAYNGTQPQLIYLLNPSTGNYINTPVATGTTANGVWETLTYTTPVITQDTVLEFYILCNGTAGFINISDWDSNLNNNSKVGDYTGVSGLYTEPDHRFPIKNYAYLY
jgi:hypothetical protein